MKYVFFLLMIVLSSNAARAEFASEQQLRQFIRVFNLSVPQSELFPDVIENQLRLPENTPTEVAIYESAQLRARAERVLQEMRAYGGSWNPMDNSTYNEALKGTLEIFFNEPESRRAIQYLFDVIKDEMFSDSQQAEHLRKQQRISPHLIQGAAVGAFAVPAMLMLRNIRWSQAKNIPGVLRSGRQKLSQVRRPHLPHAHQLVTSLRISVYKAYEGSIGTVGRIMQRRFWSAALWQGGAGLLAFGASGLAGAAAYGVPSFYLYKHGLFPFDHKKNPFDELDHTYFYAAILDLTCRQAEFDQTLEQLDLQAMERPQAELAIKDLKIALNDMADQYSFLSGAAPMFRQPRVLPEALQWDEQGTVQIEDLSFSCEVLAGRTRSPNNDMISLMPLRERIHNSVTRVIDIAQEFQFGDATRALEAFYKDHEASAYAEGQVLWQDNSDVSQMMTARSDISDFSLYLVLINMADFNANWDSPFFALLNSYLQGTGQDVYAAASQLAQTLITSLSVKDFNTFVTSAAVANYVEPEKRWLMTILSAALSRAIHDARESGLIEDADKLIDPLEYVVMWSDSENTQKTLEDLRKAKEQEAPAEEAPE